jgi:hypothetical protein
VIRKLIALWVASWIFLLWSVLCVGIGAVLFRMALVADLARRGIDL